MKKLPRILTGAIQFLTPPDDGFEEQEHEREEHGSPIIRNAPKAGGGDPDYEKRKADFLAKNSASQKAPPELGGKPTNTPTQDQVEQARKEAEAKAAREAEQKSHSEEVAKEGKEKRGPGANVPKILEDKRAAEKERDDFKAKVEEFETKTKPELDKKIADLQAKIDSGNFSSKKEQEFQARIDTLEKEKKEQQDDLVNENKRLRDTVAFYDIQSTPEFQKEYIEPVLRAHTGMIQSLNGSKKAAALLERALAANSFALNARDEETKQAAITERGEAYRGILNEINDEVLSDNFKGFFRDYLRYADAHEKALKDHQGTKAKITKEAKLRAERAYADQLASWGTAYDAKAAAFKADETLTPEELDVAKDLELDPMGELKRNNLIASKVVVGQTSMDEALDIVHNGRVAPILRARVKILEQQLKDRDAVIEKLRGAGTGGGGAASAGRPAARPNAPVNAPKNEDGQPQTREEWHKKFQPK